MAPTWERIFPRLTGAWQAFDRWLHYLAVFRWLYTGRYACWTFTLQQGNPRLLPYDRTWGNKVFGAHSLWLLINRSGADFCRGVFWSANQRMIPGCVSNHQELPCPCSSVPMKNLLACWTPPWSTIDIDCSWSWGTPCTLKLHCLKLHRFGWKRHLNYCENRHLHWLNRWLLAIHLSKLPSPPFYSLLKILSLQFLIEPHLRFLSCGYLRGQNYVSKIPSILLLQPRAYRPLEDYQMAWTTY